MTEAGRPAPADQDELAAFAPLVIVIRWATVTVGIALAAVDQGLTMRTGTGAAVLVAYAFVRTLRPIRYLRESVASLLVVLGEVLLSLAVVVATGYWESSYVLCLANAIIAAGLARGFAFAIRTAATATAAVAIPYHAAATDPDRLRTVQGVGLLVLVALVAGYARRVLGEAEQRTTEAMERIDRLTEANELLAQLHHVAQELPASLDLDETLDSTLAQVRRALQPDAAAIILRERAAGTWTVAAGYGARFPTTIHDGNLPASVVDVVATREPKLVVDYSPAGMPNGFLSDARGGVYAPLVARDKLIGVVVAESRSADFGSQALSTMNEVCAQAGLAIENARWFRLLRSVGADEERNRIARDLHDRVGQSLAYLAFELDRLARKPESAPLEKDIDQLRHDVRRTVTEVRETLHDLRTDVSDEKDLVAVVRGFIERVAARSDAEIDFTFDAPVRLPLRQEREMWRIAQEAITNAERHSGATTITVRWECDGSGARLEVADDGKGIPAQRLAAADHYGIVGMRERAEAIGAILDISAGDRGGTIVRCVLEAT